MKKNSGYVQTPQRKVILEELSKLKTHPSADQLFELVRKKLPKISLGTIYRNLDYLSEEGIIKKLDSGSGQKRFDYNVNHHYHIRCIKCDRIDDIEIPINHELQRSIIDATDFEIINHNLEFTGICPNCKSINNN